MNQEEVMTGGDEPLTAEEAAQVLDALDEGDTGALDDGSQEGSEAPDAAADDAGSGGEDAKAPAEGEAEGDTEAEPDGEDKGGATEGDGSDAVVLARDGKHTIPYEKLQEARQGWQQASAQVQALQQQLEALKAQQRGEPQGEPEAQDEEEGAGDGDEIFGDFSEEALAKGINKIVNVHVTQALKQVMEQVMEQVQPVIARENQRAQQEHDDYIRQRHPNAVATFKSQAFADWVKTLPAHMQAGVLATFDEKIGGTAQEVCNVLDSFEAYAKSKATQGAKPSTSPDLSAAKTAAKSAIAQAKAAPPSSLSSIPGGRVDGRDLFARLDDMSGAELLAATEEMSKEQIDAWLNRSI